MEVGQHEQVVEDQQAFAVHEAVPRWFIDAWYPVDGRVFISQRTERDDLWEEADGGADAPESSPIALLLMAPDFEPEPIERRLAFGAVQRGAQEGFSIDGEHEYGFDSVAQLSAFVRRIYSASGPGTTGGVGPPVPPPNPEHGGPREPWPQLELDDLDDPGEFSDTQAQAWTLPRDESIELADIEQRLIAVDPRQGAAKLLIGSLAAAFEQTDGTLTLERVLPQLYAVMLLIPGARDFFAEKFIPAMSARLLPTKDPALVKILVDIEEIVQFGFNHPCFLQVRIEDLAAWRLPLDRPFNLELPAHVHSWLDALCYLRADRSYFSNHQVGEWGALLLALMMPLALGATDGWGYRHGYPYGFTSFLVGRSIRMAAEIVPGASLPPALENNIEQWSRRAGPDLSAAPPTQPPPSQPPPSQPPPSQPPPSQPLPLRTLSAG